MILNQFKRFLIAATLTITISSCATIIGGSNYNAHVVVENHPKAKVSYKGNQRSRGFCKFRIRRKKAHKIAFTISQDSCDAQTFYFKEKKFRHGIFSATVSSNVLLGVLIAPDLLLLPIPIGIDFLTGAIWRPDVKEHGVSKINSRNYLYTIDNYTGCETKEAKIAEQPIISQPAITPEPEKPVETPVIQQNVPVQNTTPQNKGQEKITRLKELKRLQDEGILTPEEFEREKQKVLNDEF